MSKRSRPPGGLVYSTDPGFISQGQDGPARETLPPADQRLRVILDRKQRAGKIVTLVTGFEGNDTDLADLGKRLKTVCGTGGSVKDGEVIIQGDHAEKIAQWLVKNGYPSVKRG